MFTLVQLGIYPQSKGVEATFSFMTKKKKRLLKIISSKYSVIIFLPWRRRGGWARRISAAWVSRWAVRLAPGLQEGTKRRWRSARSRRVSGT